MTTGKQLQDVLSTMDDLKRKFHAERTRHVAREKELQAELSAMRKKLKDRPVIQIAAEAPATTPESRKTVRKTVAKVLDDLLERHKAERERWDGLTKEERNAASQEARLRAHPFAAEFLKAVRKALTDAI